MLPDVGTDANGFHQKCGLDALAKILAGYNLTLKEQTETPFFLRILLSRCYTVLAWNTEFTC